MPTTENRFEENISTENIHITNGAPEKIPDTGENFTPIEPDNFNHFSYSKKTHYNLFRNKGYDKLFYGNEIYPLDKLPISSYQNLLVFSFITENIPEGARILQIGSMDNYILNHFRQLYECWRIDDPAVLTVEKTTFDNNPELIIRDNLGEYKKYLPLDYFDFIFSISTFEDIPYDIEIYKNILNNTNSMLRHGGYSLQCFPSFIFNENIIHNRLLNYFNDYSYTLFHNVTNLNNFHFDGKVPDDPDLHSCVEEFKFAEKLKVDRYLNCASYNILWKKNYYELKESTVTSIGEYYQKAPSYVFHHLVKCGGTSVTETLQYWFNVEYEYPEETPSLDYFLKYKLNLSNISMDNCITGHFHFEGIHLNQRYPEIIKNERDFKVFAFIRDPLKIRISLYYYNKNLLGISNISLHDSIKHFTKNFLATLFPCDETNYKEVLDRYFFIGIVEKMQESFDKLADLINKKRLTLPFSNTTQKDSQVSELSPEFIAKFKNENKLDYMIYDYCVEKYNKI